MIRGEPPPIARHGAGNVRLLEAEMPQQLDEPPGDRDVRLRHFFTGWR